MVRLIAIALLIALAFVLIRYRTNENCRRGRYRHFGDLCHLYGLLDDL